MNAPENWSSLAFKEAESWANVTLKSAISLEDAQKLATQCAKDAVRDLEKFNQQYAHEHTWFDDGSYFKFVPMDNKEIERVVAVMSRYYLFLWHRRGLIGF
jgi:hypothetical protein